MRLLIFALALILVPAPAYAFFFEEVYASGEVQVQQQDPSGLTGRQAREYRERLQQQYEAEAAASSASTSLTTEDPVSNDVPVQHYYDQLTSSSTTTQSSHSSQTSQSSQSSVEQTNIYTPPPPPEQEELDRLTLEQLEAYANEAQANMEEQMKILEEGFSITSTSSLGSPLTVAQREAILRRDVRTTDQLKLFARALAESDDRIRQITVDESGVTMSIRSKVYLFGFIPLNTIWKTTVEGEQVSVDLPWWTVLAWTGSDTSMQKLQEDLLSLQEEFVLLRLQEMMKLIADL